MVASPASALPVLLEDSWEATDVIEECARLGVPCTELSPEQLRTSYSAEAFVGSHTFMCDTELAQERLREYFGCEDLEAIGVVPCTYPEEFGVGNEVQSAPSDPSALDYFFARDIRKRHLGEVAACLETFSFGAPLFVKPGSNDKTFDGKVVRDTEDLEAIWAPVRSTVKRSPDDSASSPPENFYEVFTSPAVRFRIEYRLFIGGGRVYGGADAWHMVRAEPGLDTLFDTRGAGKEGACPVPEAAFVEAILQRVGPERFWVVDIGLVAAEGDRRGGEPREQEQWAIVEVNPPFSFDDHGLAIGPYCQYCFDACAWIRSLRK